MFFLLERLFVQRLQFLPEILVKLFQREILAFFKFVEESFFQNSNSVFYGAFELRLANLGWQNNGTIVISPVSIILIQLRLDPVLIDNNGLLTVIADY